MSHNRQHHAGRFIQRIPIRDECQKYMTHSPEKLYIEQQLWGHVILLMDHVSQEGNIPNSPHHNNQTGKGKREFQV